MNSRIPSDKNFHFHDSTLHPTETIRAELSGGTGLDSLSDYEKDFLFVWMGNFRVNSVSSGP